MIYDERIIYHYIDDSLNYTLFYGLSFPLYELHGESE